MRPAASRSTRSSGAKLMWTDRGSSSALTRVPSGRRISTTLGQRRNVPKRLGLGGGTLPIPGSGEIQRGVRSNSTPAGQFGVLGLEVPASCTVMSQLIVIYPSPVLDRVPLLPLDDYLLILLHQQHPPNRSRTQFIAKVFNHEQVRWHKVACRKPLCYEMGAHRGYREDTYPVP